MQKRCILCADPDPELRSNLGFLLAGENCVLEEAAGGATLLTPVSYTHLFPLRWCFWPPATPPPSTGRWR